MKYLIIMSLLIFPMLGISQAPQRINFQSILRNTTGEVVSNKAVSLRISILSDSITGPAVYVETHARTTDAGGLMSLQIGNGTAPSTDFATINWGNSAHFIKLEADFNGGNSYVLLGTQELMSVPYALYASKTDTGVLNLRTRFSTKFNVSDTILLSNRITTKLNETDTSLLNLTSRFSTKLNSSDFPAGSDTGNIMYFNGSTWVILPLGDEGQSLKMSSGSPVWGSVPTNTVGGATSAPTLMVNTGLTPITHSTTNATGIGTATGLPTGVTASWSANTITISGTPSSSGTFSYNIPLSGGCGCVNAPGTITVTAPCATAAASTTPTVWVDTALTPITHTTTSATGIGSATGLPSGVSAAWVSNVIIIMGTPSASGNFNYTIPLTGTGCTSWNATGTITVNVTTATLTTSSVSTIASTSVSSGGDISLGGGATVSARGLVYNTSTNPTLSNRLLTIGSGIGSFSITLTGLSPNTTYYIRAYATNSVGTAYGNEVSFTTIQTVTDIDGNIYNTVQIGNQVWMSENLKTLRYRNGGLIPYVTDNTAWANKTTSARSYYNNDASNNPIYGKLYNWYTTLGDTLCPTGWGVPTDAEWTTLTDSLGGLSVAGGKMKTIGDAYWNDPNIGAINSSGFSVLPGGYRNGNVGNGSFNGFWNIAYFWSASQLNANDAWLRYLYYGNGYVTRDDLNKTFGASVRCLRD